MKSTRRKPATRKPVAPKKLSLADAIAKVKKDYDLDIGVQDVEWIPTGNLALDYVIGGGFPRGRIVEVYGLQSSGKTTAALQVAAREQQAGRTILFLDYEQSLDPIYCKTLGLDLLDSETCIVAQPDTFEQGMNSLRTFVQTGKISMVIVDSVAAMVIEKELASDAGEGVGAMQKARLMAQELRKLGAAIAEAGTCVVFLNHVRDVIDMSPMGQKLSGAGVKRKTTPGGSALKFHASVRLYFKGTKKIYADRFEPLANESLRAEVGTYIEVKAEKNKCGFPYRKAEMMMRYGAGFDPAWNALQVLLSHGSIKKRTGGIYEFDEDTQWDGIDTVRGEANTLEAINAHPDWLEHLSVLSTRVLAESEDFEVPVVEESEEVEDTGVEASPSDVDALLSS